jgi:hypothetical protein
MTGLRKECIFLNKNKKKCNDKKVLSMHFLMVKKVLSYF